MTQILLGKRPFFWKSSKRPILLHEKCLFDRNTPKRPKIWPKKHKFETEMNQKQGFKKKIRLRRCPWCLTVRNRGPQKEKEPTEPHRYAAETHPGRRHHRLPHHECFFSVSKVHKSDTETSEKILFFLHFLYCWVQNPRNQLFVDTRTFRLWKVAQSRFWTAR